jgi:ribonuclease HI
MITIYTDGSARGNPGPGGWGAILVDGDTVREIGGREDHTTNNRMELSAAINALENARGNEVVVNTDSEYVMKGITEWIYDWQRRGWKTASKKPVLNQDLWQELLVATEGKNIEWKYVRGHVGHKTNERADVIATEFADKSEIELYDGPKSGYKYL